ncbi:hypothetical protein ACIRF8_02645 [Streptomyces sp. NPDC102406]|uniref:hypothetical protein n=1 Tax=Streptomyces sp. NPDC102406 TaxID=3366171 RepID=UPI0037FF8FA3
MENWREDALSGHTHDPNEVTVQLDGAGRQLGALLTAGAGPGGSVGTLGVPVGGKEGKEVPVFVDDSGRRGRTFRRVGVAMGLACAVYAVVIVLTMLWGNSSAPWLPMPKEPADKVDTKPLLPVESSTPSISPGTTPGPSVSGTAPGSAVTPGAGKAPSQDAGGDDAEPDRGAGTGSAPPGRPGVSKPKPPAVPTAPGSTTTPPVVPPVDPPAGSGSPTPVEPSGVPTADPVGGGSDITASRALPGRIVAHLPGGAPAPSFAPLERGVL